MRFQVPLTNTPSLKTSSGPLPVGSTITSRPPNEFSTHGPIVYWTSWTTMFDVEIGVS